MKDEILPDHWQYRPRATSWDWNVFDSVAVHNEYHLPADLRGWRVLDAGAHTGAFTWACLTRGAAQVRCYEPWRPNFELLRSNVTGLALDGFDPRPEVQCYQLALWRSDVDQGTKLPFSPCSVPENTGGGGVMGSERDDSEDVYSWRFDDAVLSLTENGRYRLNLAKLDCEGSEWPILLTSHTLHLIDALAGEYHEIAASQVPPLARVGEPRDYERGLLTDALRAAGFEVVGYHSPGISLGHFWATRPGVGCHSKRSDGGAAVV